MTESDLAAAKRHRYRIEGKPVPGVTTVIDVIDKPQFKWKAAEIAAETAIANWRKKKAIVASHREWLSKSRGNTPTSVKKRTLAQLGSDNDIYAHWCRGEFDRQWRAKGDRGNRVHDVAHAWANGEATDVSRDDSGFVDALERFHLDYYPRFEMMECIVLNTKYQYGGRFDAIATFRALEMVGDAPRYRSTGTYLIDYKTGGQWTIPVAMQLVAYSMADVATYTERGTLMSLDPLPKIDGVRVVYLNEDGTYEVQNPLEKIDADTAWEGFLASLHLYNVNKKMNELVKENIDDDSE